MKPTGLKEFAYGQIKEMLLKGDIKPGDRIMEAELAEKISVSRTPVREAINQLVAAGFIIEKPRHGLFAVKLTKKQLDDIGTIRGVLSNLAVEQCCANIDVNNSSELKEALDNLIRACNDGSFSDVSRCDGEFHKTIAHLTTNDKLYSYVCDIEDIVVYSRQMDNYVYDKDELIESHTNMFNSILSKNPDYAKEMMSWKNVQTKYQNEDSTEP